MNRLSVAVIGAGMGGRATAAALRRVGIEVTVYEQARRFGRVGAGIQIACNAMKVLRALGFEPTLRAAAFEVSNSLGDVLDAEHSVQAGVVGSHHYHRSIHNGSSRYRRRGIFGTDRGGCVVSKPTRFRIGRTCQCGIRLGIQG